MPEIYPWNILEMSCETTDERSVRRAYAQKLKKCRPEEDPEGFQILLQARNHALLLLKEISHIDTSEQLYLKDKLQREETIGQGDGRDARLRDDETVSDIYDEQFSHRYFEEKLEEMNDPSLNIWELPYWHDFFAALNNASFHSRQDIEWLLIRQLGNRLFEGSLSDDFRAGSHKLNQDKAQNVLSLLDEEFGWTDNDQKVYKVLGHNDGDLFLSLIRSAASQNVLISRETKTNNTAIPYIPIPDLRALTGDNGEDIVQYYIAACQSGKWGQGLDWSEFLFGYIWQAWRALWKVSLAIIFLQGIIMAVMLSVYGFQPLLSGAVAGLLGILPLLFIARYGKYRVVHFAIETLADTKNIPIGNSLQRYHYLKGKGRGNVFFTPLMVSAPFVMVLLVFVLTQ